MVYVSHYIYVINGNWYKCIIMVEDKLAVISDHK